MRWITGVIVLLALLAGLWWFGPQRQAEPEPESKVDPLTESEPAEPRYPLSEREREPVPDDAIDPAGAGSDETDSSDRPVPEPLPPLPELAASDGPILSALSDPLGNDFVQQWIKPEFVIPRIVAAVNSLDGPAPALRTRPLEPLDTEPATEKTGNGDTLLWTHANAQRYEVMASALESLPPATAASLYRRYYPLFQQAWNELGEPDAYFNDRLVDVIDHLLAAPRQPLPVEVLPYEGRLHFADESLQDESWGRKLLVRMGESNRDRLTAWLRQFRSRIVGSETP